MPFTQNQIKNAAPGDKPTRLFDGRGLYLEIAPSGGRWWRFKYRYAGKEKRISLGVYPEVSIKDARDRCEDARRALSGGIDPSATRRAAKFSQRSNAANSFVLLAREWLEKQAGSWSESHHQRVKRLFERDLFPWLGNRPVAQVSPAELLGAIQRIEGRGALETAHRALGNCRQVFRYAVATARAARDPAADFRGALPPVKGEHFAAITEPKRVGELLRVLDGYEGTLPV